MSYTGPQRQKALLHPPRMRKADETLHSSRLHQGKDMSKESCSHLYESLHVFWKSHSLVCVLDLSASPVLHLGCCERFVSISNSALWPSLTQNFFSLLSHSPCHIFSVLYVSRKQFYIIFAFKIVLILLFKY